jgi:hypothetical protein
MDVLHLLRYSNSYNAPFRLPVMTRSLPTPDAFTSRTTHHAPRIHPPPPAPLPCSLFPVWFSAPCLLLPVLCPPSPSQTYIETMPQCLVTYCTSAPSTAYALEYGFSWCRRAGVDVTSSLALPQSYLDGPASAYFK